MHKKKYCFIIITLICSAFMITGCSNNRNVKNGEREEETATESSSSENTVTNTENNTENVAETSFNVRINYRFNEGVEWIQEMQMTWVRVMHVLTRKVMLSFL